MSKSLGTVVSEKPGYFALGKCLLLSSFQRLDETFKENLSGVCGEHAA
jgi:hypothetical protein